MRVRDELKQQAIIDATVKLVNEIGFVACSVAKIAAEAGVSPATLYVYYQNKEDLLISTYIGIKQEMSAAILHDLDTRQPLRDIFKSLWFNTFEFVTTKHSYYQFTEQFANSPYSGLVDHSRVDVHFEPLYRLIQRGIDEKIIKNVPADLLTVFLFYPITNLANDRLCRNFDHSTENIEQAFNMAWDAIRL
jgi:AcrR family transcriptional regulator